MLARPGHLILLYLFVVFAVVSAKLILLGPANGVPGAKTIGAAL